MDFRWAISESRGVFCGAAAAAQRRASGAQTLRNLQRAADFVTILAALRGKQQQQGNGGMA
jgi:hypothetical protein